MSGFGLNWKETSSETNRFPGGADWATRPNGINVEMDTMGVQHSFTNKFNGQAPNELALIQLTVRAMQTMALDEWTNFMTTQIVTSARLWIVTRQWHPLFEAQPTAIGASARMGTTEEVRHARGTDRIATSFQYDGEMLQNANGLRNLRNIILNANRSLMIRKALTTQAELVRVSYRVHRGRIAAGYFTRGFNQQAFRDSGAMSADAIKRHVSDFYMHEAQTYAPLSQPGAKLGTTIFRMKAIHEKLNMGINYNTAAICSMTEEVMSDEALRERRFVLNVGTKEVNAVDVPASGRRLRLGDMRVVPAIPVPRQMMLDCRTRGRGLVVVDAKGSYALWEQRLPNSQLGLLDEANNSYHWFSVDDLINNCVLFAPGPGGALRPAGGGPGGAGGVGGAGAGGPGGAGAGGGGAGGPPRSLFHDEDGNPYNTFADFFDNNVFTDSDETRLTEALTNAIIGAGYTRADADRIVAGVSKLSLFMEQCAEARWQAGHFVEMAVFIAAGNRIEVDEYNAPLRVTPRDVMTAVTGAAFGGPVPPNPIIGMGSWEGIKRLVALGSTNADLIDGYNAMRALISIFERQGVPIEESVVLPAFGGLTRTCALNAFAPTISLFAARGGGIAALDYVVAPEADLLTQVGTPLQTWLDAAGSADVGRIVANGGWANNCLRRAKDLLVGADEIQATQITAAVNRFNNLFTDQRLGLRAIYSTDLLSGIRIHALCDTNPRTTALEAVVAHLFNGGSAGELTQDEGTIKKIRTVAHYAVKNVADFQRNLDAITAAANAEEVRAAVAALASAAKEKSGKLSPAARFTDLKDGLAAVPELFAPSAGPGVGVPSAAPAAAAGGHVDAAGVEDWVRIPGVTLSYEQARDLVNDAALYNDFRPSWPTEPHRVCLAGDAGVAYGAVADPFPGPASLAARSMRARVGAAADVSYGRDRESEYAAEHVGAGAEHVGAPFTFARPFLAPRAGGARSAFPPAAATGRGSRFPLAVRVILVALGALPINKQTVKTVARILPNLWRYLLMRPWRQRFTESILLAVAGYPTSFSPTSNAFITREQMGDTEVVTKATCYYTTVVVEPQNLCLLDHARIFARGDHGHGKKFAGMDPTPGLPNTYRLLQTADRPTGDIISMLVPNRDFETKAINVFGDYNEDEAPMLAEHDPAAQQASPHYIGDAFMRAFFQTDYLARATEAKRRKNHGWGDRFINWVCLPEAMWQRDTQGTITRLQFSNDHLGHIEPGTARLRAYGDALPYASEAIGVAMA